MKNLIMLIATVFIIQACKVETPLNNSNVLSQYDKYNIDKDTNWVEITDTTRIDLTCVGYFKDTNLVITSNDNYKKLWNESQEKHKEWMNSKKECSVYKELDIDFNKYILQRRVVSDGSYAKFKHRFYYNLKNQEYLSILEHERSDIKDRIPYIFDYQFPKYDLSCKITFDTIYCKIR